MMCPCRLNIPAPTQFHLISNTLLVLHIPANVLFSLTYNQDRSYTNSKKTFILRPPLQKVRGWLVTDPVRMHTRVLLMVHSRKSERSHVLPASWHHKRQQAGT